jgi:hypothetical protein
MRMTIAALALAALASPAAATPFDPDEIAARALERRAVEAVIWGMPAVNYDLMLQAMLDITGAEPNQVVYWGRPIDWMNQTLTPNPDTLYFMTFTDTRDGPFVIEVPVAEGGSLNGNLPRPPPRHRLAPRRSRRAPHARPGARSRRSRRPRSAPDAALPRGPSHHPSPRCGAPDRRRLGPLPGADRRRLRPAGPDAAAPYRPATSYDGRAALATARRWIGRQHA